MMRRVHEAGICGRVTVCLLALGVCLSSAGRGAGLKTATMKSAIVPQANILFLTDAAASRDTEIQKKIDALRGEIQDSMVPGSKALMMQQKIEEITESLGLTPEDLVTLAFSVSLEGLDFESMPDWQQLRALAAVELEKPITIDTVKLAANRIAAETGHDVMYDRSEYQGVPLLSIVSGMENPDPNLPSELFIALPDGGKAAYIGLEGSVKAALDRLAESNPAPLTEEMAAAQKSVPGKSQSFLLFVPTDLLRGKLQALGKDAPQNNPMMANAVQALGGLKHLAYSAHAGTKLDMLVSGNFATAQQAIQMKSMIDMAVLGMAKMMIMQAVGRPIPLVESMKSNQQGTEASMEFALTEEDLKALMEAQAAGMPPFGAGGGQPPVPPVPHQMQGVPAN